MPSYIIKKTHQFPDIISINAQSHPKQTNKQTNKQQTKKGEVRMFVRLLNTQSVFLQIFYLEIYSHQIPFLKLRQSPGFALVMLKSESHLHISPLDVIVPSWPIFALVLSLSWAVGIIGWALVSTAECTRHYYVYILSFRGRLHEGRLGLSNG